MKKIVVIDDCLRCPSLERLVFPNVFKCRKTGKFFRREEKHIFSDLWYFDPPYTIPHYCPLPNAEEEDEG